MAENQPVEAMRIRYAEWMGSYEKFMQANDTYCFHLDEATKKQHLEPWFQEREIYVANVKASAEDWFVGRIEQQRVASKRSTSRSQRSAAKLAVESKKVSRAEGDGISTERKTGT